MFTILDAEFIRRRYRQDMIAEVLKHFPEQSAPLYVVSDPDDVLADEDLLTALYARGYSLIEEPDPVQLRHRLLQSDGRSDDRSLIVVTDDAVEQVPYDLWQQAVRVNLKLPRFFPNLAYPVLQSLTAGQRSRLSQVPPPPRRLGQRTSIDHILEHVFGVDRDDWQDPSRFIAWLDAYHSGATDPLPALFVERLQQRLQEIPHYRDWPLEALLTDSETFRGFLDSQWRTYVSRETGRRLGEPSPQYVLSFEKNEGLQDALPRLLRSGSLQRVDVSDPDRLPAWARPAVVAPDEDLAERRMTELLEQLSLQADDLRHAHWSQWQLMARTWAEYSNLAHTALPDDTSDYQQWQARLDELFLEWLQERYAPLGAKKLPTPHHLFHVPEYLAWQRSHRDRRPVALIILDGMALADWYLIRKQWEGRHPRWQYDELLLLAQIPSITPVSRQALVGGERPAEFADHLSDNDKEKSRWSTFWTGKNVPPTASLYGRLYLKTGEEPAGLTSSRLQAACLVNSGIDDISHGTSLGAAEMVDSVDHWLDKRSPQLEDVIARLLARDVLVYLTSDHGHTEAEGIGNPREGQIAEKRGHRARVYRDRALAEEVQTAFPDTILWESDGLLPDDACVLMPRGRHAFISERESVVTHGGLTMDEMIVPLVRIFQST